MTIVERWGALEADFLRYYNISNPLSVSWGRFLRLVTNMPFKDSVFFLPMYTELQNQSEDSSEDEEDKTDRRHYKRQLDKARGREGKKREVVSLDKFMEDIGNR